MEWHIQRLLNRLSVLIAAVATLSLLHLFLSSRSSSSSSCSPSATGAPHHPHHSPLAHTRFPISTCDPALSSRSLLTHEARFKKLSASLAFKKRSQSLSRIFDALRSLRLLSNSSHVLLVSAGAGHGAFALHSSGVAEVTAVDLVEFPPFVKRSDPHNLPFFDGAFDLGFSDGLDVALFPGRFAEEMERTVREGGAAAVVVERVEGEEEVEEIRGLFRRSRLVEVRDVSLDGAQMSLIVMRKNNNETPGTPRDLQSSIPPAPPAASASPPVPANAPLDSKNTTLIGRRNIGIPSGFPASLSGPAMVPSLSKNPP